MKSINYHAFFFRISKSNKWAIKALKTTDNLWLDTFRYMMHYIKSNLFSIDNRKIKIWGRNQDTLDNAQEGEHQSFLDFVALNRHEA